MTIERPVHAAPMPLSLDSLATLALAVERLYGADCTTRQVGSTLVVFTPGEPCNCRSCEHTLLDVIRDADPFALPFGMREPTTRCPDCNETDCYRTSWHGDLCDQKVRDMFEPMRRRFDTKPIPEWAQRIAATDLTACTPPIHPATIKEPNP